MFKVYLTSTRFVWIMALGLTWSGPWSNLILNKTAMSQLNNVYVQKIICVPWIESWFRKGSQSFQWIIKQKTKTQGWKPWKSVCNTLMCTSNMSRLKVCLPSRRVYGSYFKVTMSLLSWRTTYIVLCYTTKMIHSNAQDI